MTHAGQARIAYVAEWRFHDPDADINPATFSAFISARNLRAAEQLGRTFAKRNKWRFVQCYEATNITTEPTP